MDCRPAAARVAPRILRGSNNGSERQSGRSRWAPSLTLLENGAAPRHAAPVRFDDSDQADSSQVEDRRGGGRFPGGARLGVGVGGLGAVGAVVYIALQVLASGGNQTAGEITRMMERDQGAPGAGDGHLERDRELIRGFGQQRQAGGERIDAIQRLDGGRSRDEVRCNAAHPPVAFFVVHGEAPAERVIDDRSACRSACGAVVVVACADGDIPVVVAKAGIP